MECSNNNLDGLEDTKWHEVIDKYIDSAKLNIRDYINIVERHINILINDTKLKNKYIDKIINMFEPEDEILRVLEELNIVEDENILCLYKVFSKYGDNQDVVNCIKNILENKENIYGFVNKVIQEDLDVKLLINICNISKKFNFEEIITNVMNLYKENEVTFNQNSKIKILRIVCEKTKKSKSLKNDIMLLTTDILNNLDISEVNEVIELLINNKNIFDKENRKILINKFEVTIEKMDENEKNEMKNKLENFK